MEKRTKEAYLVDKAGYKDAFLEYVLRAHFFGDYGRTDHGYYSNNCRLDPFDMVLTDVMYGGHRLIFGLDRAVATYEADYKRNHFALIQTMYTGDVYIYSAISTNDNYYDGWAFDKEIQDAVIHCFGEEPETDLSVNSYIQKIEELKPEDEDSKLKALGEMVVDKLKEYVKLSSTKNIDSLQRLSISNTDETVWVTDEDGEWEEDVDHWSYAFYEIDPNEYEIYMPVR